MRTSLSEPKIVSFMSLQVVCYLNMYLSMRDSTGIIGYFLQIVLSQDEKEIKWFVGVSEYWT